MAAEKDKTEPTLLQQANAGDAQAMFRLSLECSDDAKAAKWLRKAANQGYSPAQNNLGVLIAKGRANAPVSYFQKTVSAIKAKFSKSPITTGTDDAVYWYRQAAERGNAHGQCNYGWRLAIGQGTDKDVDEAIK